MRYIPTTIILEVTHLMSDNIVLLLSRELDAPRDLVFKVWSEAEHFKHWWGPDGMPLEVEKFEFEQGGMFLYSMSTPDGQKMYGKFVYREIASPEKIVFVNSFCDAEGNTIRAPFSEHWPLEIHNTLTLTDKGGKTQMALRGYPLTEDEAELAFFKSMQENVAQGMNGTIDQLVAYLASRV